MTVKTNIWRKYYTTICSRQKFETIQVSFIHRNVVNFYIFYELDTWSRDLNTYFTLANCLYGAVKLIKNLDPDKYGYRGYGVGFGMDYGMVFDARSQFWVADGSRDKSAVISGVSMSLLLHVHNKKRTS